MQSLSLVAAFTAAILSISPPAQAADPSGCGRAHQSGFHDVSVERTIQSRGGDRTYAVYVPQAYDPHQPWPLIVDYHGRRDHTGAGGTPETQYENSRYEDYEAGRQHLVAYPAGVRGQWQGPAYADPNISDLDFTRHLLAHLRQTYCIDPNRVYASGKSNGGGFVDLLACSDQGDEFAAFAMAAAALYTDNSPDACAKKRPIMEAHGVVNDDVIPYHGTDAKKGGQLPDVREWVSWWAERCDPTAKTPRTQEFSNYTWISYSCGDVEDVVQHYAMKELGHCWPSGEVANYDRQREPQHSKDSSLDYTPAVLDFFGQWTLESAKELNKQPLLGAPFAHHGL